MNELRIIDTVDATQFNKAIRKAQRQMARFAWCVWLKRVLDYLAKILGRKS